MTDLPHIASRLFGTPLMIARPKLDAILGVLGPRLAGQALEPLDIGAAPARATAITPDGIAVIPVAGTLVSRSGYLAAASGLTSYGDIGDAVEAAVADALVRGIVFDIDSPGGEVGGLFDLVERIAALARESGKPIWAVAGEAALSAAYAIASAADRLVITQTGEVGSVGVVAVHVDESGADRMAGLSWTFVHAGERKIDGNPHEPLSPRARADVQTDVDRLYDRFVALVARNRNLPPEAVRATEAAVYRGDLAVKAGLADRVGTLRDAVADLVATLAPKPTTRGRAARPTESRKEASMQTADPTINPGAEGPVPPAPDAAPVQGPAVNVSDVTQVEQRLRGEYAELAAVAAQAARLGLKVDAAEAMAKGVRADALRRSVLDELATRSDAADIVATAPAAARPAESPIVKRAKQAAGKGAPA
ncbi:MAG: S49 family peptidase [Rhodospirillales bacterium]|nr:S49 family peptidase [Rhodospirillales bacterium]